MPRKKALWNHAEGEKGWTVTVYERAAGGLLYARAFDPSLRNGRGGYRRHSLGHRDQEKAKVYASTKRPSCALAWRKSPKGGRRWPGCSRSTRSRKKGS
jgi:hypothetical protein